MPAGRERRKAFADRVMEQFPGGGELDQLGGRRVLGVLSARSCPLPPARVLAPAWFNQVAEGMPVLKFAGLVVTARGNSATRQLHDEGGFAVRRVERANGKDPPAPTVPVGRPLDLELVVGEPAREVKDIAPAPAWAGFGLRLGLGQTLGQGVE